MTTTTLRKKIVSKVSQADERLLKLVNALIVGYEETNEEQSLLTATQKKEIDRRLELHHAGKLKYYTLSEIKKTLIDSQKNK